MMAITHPFACVVGSINMDIQIRVPRFPQHGETMHATYISRGEAGGKGLNSAVAVQKFCNSINDADSNAHGDANAIEGNTVVFVARVGNDPHATMLREQAQKHVQKVHFGPPSQQPQASGQAYIVSDNDGGGSTIILHGGANMSGWPTNQNALEADVLQDIASARALLLQREIPDIINVIAKRHAQANGVPVWLDLGGLDDVCSDELLDGLYCLSCNETELMRMMPMTARVTSSNELQDGQSHRILFSDDISKRTQQVNMMHSLHERGVCNVLLTLGERGSLMLCENGELIEQPAFTVPVVDTTGAGDVFRAALVTRMLLGDSMHDGMRWASMAAALCTCKAGVIDAIPTPLSVNDAFQAYL